MNTQKRAGFTLIELMVAMALTLFIMVILTQAFTTSLETFAAMKGIGDMQVNLRTAGNILRDDLKQDHLEGKRRLSDIVAPPVPVQPANGAPLLGAQQPQAGFLAVLQGSAPVSAATATAATPYVDEGLDANNLHSYRASDHVLYMTVKRKGNRQENFFNAYLQGTTADLATFFSKTTAYDVNPITQLPYATWTTPYTAGSTSGFYGSQWAEVVYYLKRTGSSEEPNNPASTLGSPTFALYRAQFVMVPDSTNVTGTYSAAGLELTTFAGLSCNKSNANAALINFFSPADAASYVAGQTPLIKRVIPQLPSFAPQAAAVNNVTARVQANEALLLPNVLSFHIQIMSVGTNAFQDVPGQLYDTASFTAPAATYSNNFGLKAIQISLRVWDNASRQTRQMTIVQDL